MRKVLLYLFCSIFAGITGCATQLSVKQVMVDPPELAAGEDAKIVVVFTGPKNKVASVTATVRENPEFTYTLTDDGTNGDEKARDNIWTAQTTVPYEALAGTYHLDIRAMDKDGNEIVVEGLTELSTEVTVK
ncbi:MAG: choice-of-anchor X domain-containing protein [bacterium]